MNEKMLRLGFDSRFVAMAFAIYDSRSGVLELSNSGLPYPYLLRGRSLRRVEIGGVPLGMLPERSYDQTRLEQWSASLEEGQARSRYVSLESAE